jgi:hypothetical protein
MIGNNELPVNEATMIAAVQMYLNSITAGHAPKVTGISAVVDIRNDGSVFLIKVDGGEKK